MRVRRGWRYLFIFLLLGGGLLAFGLWRLSRDDERLTRWLADSVQSATGLQMRTQSAGRFGFWPRLSIALDNVELHSLSDASTPARIGSLRAQIPWSSIFGRELRVGAIAMEEVTLDDAAIRTWLAHRQDMGPTPALRWPRLDASLSIRKLRYRQKTEQGEQIDSIVLNRLQLNRWLINQPAQLDAEFTVTAFGAAAFRAEVQCTPRQTRNSIAIEPCNATIERDGSAALALRGYLRHDDFARVESQLRLEAPKLPNWVDIAPLQVDSKPVDLALRLIGAFAGPLKTKLGGSFSGIGVDADGVLPYGWIEQIAKQQWNALAEKTTGYARIDHLRSADMSMDDIEWRNEVAPEPAPVTDAKTDASVGSQ